MMVRISSKGQLVIPRQIRAALGLRPGTEVEVRLAGRQIILEPLGLSSAIDRLYGKFAGLDLLSQLELEHGQELADEPTGS